MGLEMSGIFSPNRSQASWNEADRAIISSKVRVTPET